MAWPRIEGRKHKVAIKWCLHELVVPYSLALMWARRTPAARTHREAATKLNVVRCRAVESFVLRRSGEKVRFELFVRMITLHLVTVVTTRHDLTQTLLEDDGDFPIVHQDKCKDAIRSTCRRSG